MSKDDKAIREELKELQQKIKEFKNNFSKKRNSKESAYLKGEGFSKEINNLYAEVEEIENNNNLDKINQDLEKKLVERAELEKKIEEYEKEFRELNERRVSQPKPKIKTISSEKLKKELKILEHKLQTQVLSLDKEAELVKKIEEIKNTIKTQFSRSEDGEVHVVTKKLLFKSRRKLDNIQKKIRSLYKQIRLINKEKKKKYKCIDELRVQKKEAFDSFKLSKKDYSQIGKELKELFTKEEELLSKLGEIPGDKKSKGKEIKKKQKELEEKFLKKGQKLTTEDLLMLQAGK